MKNSVYPYATGIALAGAGAMLALGAGTAQAAPTLAPPLSPATSLQCLTAPTGCPASSLPALNAVALTPNAPTPNALAAAFVGPTLNEPLYGLIGIAGEIPIV